MEGTSFSLLGMLATMNWVAKGVVVVLALMSIWSLTIAIERLWRCLLYTSPSPRD